MASCPLELPLIVPLNIYICPVNSLIVSSLIKNACYGIFLFWLHINSLWQLSEMILVLYLSIIPLRGYGWRLIFVLSSPWYWSYLLIHIFNKDAFSCTSLILSSSAYQATLVVPIFCFLQLDTTFLCILCFSFVHCLCLRAALLFIFSAWT